MKLKQRHTQESLRNPTSNVDIDPLDWAYVYTDRGDDEDPLQAWLNNTTEPLLDEGRPGGGPNATIAGAMGVDVDEYQQSEGAQADQTTLGVEEDNTHIDKDDFWQGLPEDEPDASSGSTTPEPSGGDDGGNTPDSYIRGDTPPHRTPSPRPQPQQQRQQQYESGSGTQRPTDRTYQRKGKGKAPQQQLDSLPTCYENWYPQGQGHVPQPVYHAPYNTDNITESIGSLSLGGQSGATGSTFVDDLLGFTGPTSRGFYQQEPVPGYYGGDSEGTYGSRVSHRTDNESYSYLGPGYAPDPFAATTDTTSGVQSHYYPPMAQPEPPPQPNIYVPPSDSDAERPPHIPEFYNFTPGSLASRYPTQLALYTRFGYLSEISHEDFAAYVHDYELNHSQHTTWMQYAMRIDNQMSLLRQTQEAQHSGHDFGRHSAFY